MHRLLALWMAAMLAACAGPGSPGVYQPSAPPTAKVRVGEFTLEISSPRRTWAVGEAIEMTATLTYDGSGEVTIWGAGAGPISFSVREIGGTRAMEGLMTYDEAPHQIGPADPIVVDYRKSGGWSPGDDPNEAFYVEFFADPGFRLPAGRWEVEAWTRFATRRGPYDVDTRAGLVLTIE